MRFSVRQEICSCSSVQRSFWYLAFTQFVSLRSPVVTTAMWEFWRSSNIKAIRRLGGTSPNCSHPSSHETELVSVDNHRRVDTPDSMDVGSCISPRFLPRSPVPVSTHVDFKDLRISLDYNMEEVSLCARGAPALLSCVRLSWSPFAAPGSRTARSNPSFRPHPRMQQCTPMAMSTRDLSREGRSCKSTR